MAGKAWQGRGSREGVAGKGSREGVAGAVR